jgi:uncharacterized membrane protein YhiD involved in acid resistance
MNKIQEIGKFFTPGVAPEASILIFLMNLILAAILSYWIGKVYIKYGTALSNRPAFAQNFILITLTTMLVISIVKSSLALSLGLIGALSIVRFRAAIKEPQELSYLFLAIAVGLGMGANQQIITIVAIAAIIAILRLKAYFERRDKLVNHWDPDLYLTVSTSDTESLSLDTISRIVGDICRRTHLKRADSSNNSLEVLFHIEINKEEDPRNIDMALRAQDKDVKISLLESK